MDKNKENEMMGRLVGKTQQQILKLESRVNEEISRLRHCGVSDKIKEYILSKMEKNFKDYELAEIMYERLSRVDLPPIQLEFGDTKSLTEGLNVENRGLPEAVYDVLKSFQDCVEVCNPDILREYEEVIIESKIKRTALGMLEKNSGIESDQAIEAIIGIEKYITDLPSEVKMKIRKALRRAPIDTGTSIAYGIPYSKDTERIFALGNSELKIHYERIAEIDKGLGL